MEKIFKQVSLEDLPKTADELLAFADGIPIWKFEGNLGAGKTTLIKEICKQKGVSQVVQSPTFSIVNVYETDSGEELYHFDCYRLKNMEEALDFGMEEYLYTENLCLIEWPQVVAELLPKPQLLITLEGGVSENRTIIAKKIL